MVVTDAAAVRFATFFTGREGVHARMWSHPKRGVGYSPVQVPFDPEAARAHLDGRITAGIYLVRQDQRTFHGVLDIDARPKVLARAQQDRNAALVLKRDLDATTTRLREALERAGIRPLVFDSGHKGRHLWLRFAEAEPAREVRRFLQQILTGVVVEPSLSVEVFPKQDRVPEGGLGNLVKVPLGIHRLTGCRSVLLDQEGGIAGEGLEKVLGFAPQALPPREEGAPPLQENAVELPAQEARAHRLLGGCPMVRAVFAQASRERRLLRDEVVVLHHTLGHLPDGVEMLHSLFETVPDLPDNVRLGSPLRGNPMSCAKVRKRLPDLQGRVPCDCTFPERNGDYLHPLRHLDQDESLTALLGRLAEARVRCDELEAEAREALSRETGHRYRVGEGEWVCGPDRRVVFVPDRS